MVRALPTEYKLARAMDSTRGKRAPPRSLLSNLRRCAGDLGVTKPRCITLESALRLQDRHSRPRVHHWAVVLNRVKDKPSVAAEEAAILDTACARRRC